MPTPYDGKVAVWHVNGNTVGENTLDDIIDTLRTYAPAVNAIWVKVGEGTEWAGNLGAGDPKLDLAIRGPADVDRWASKLEQVGLELHLWAIPKGNNPAAEADFLIQAASRPHVRSLILDVEPFEGFFAGGRSAIRPLMLRLRGGLSTAFHIGISVDPRPWNYDAIFPDEWRPFINSVHPQIYWADFGKSPDDAFSMTYDKWSGYGVPIVPALQGYQGRGDKITRASMDRARTLATSTYKAPGLSWFRFGTLNKTLFPAVNVTIDGKVPGGGTGTGTGTSNDPLPTGTGRYGPEIVIKPGDAGYREGTYDGTPSPLRSFQNEEGWTSKYFSANRASSNVWVNWSPQPPGSGYWEIAVYVPAQHATTNNARYKIHGIVGQGSEFEAAVQQARMDSLWVPLGIFNIDTNSPQAGALYLNDLTGESGPEIAFDAVRWCQVLGWQRPPRYLADGFDSPVGSADEREMAGTTWPSTWVSSNGYKSRYVLGGRETLHTGDDLVLKRGKTLGQQICAIASGEVVSAKREGTPPNWGSWGNVIIIRHDSLITTGQVVYSRYAHVQNMQVKAGDRVVRGQHVADVGDAFGIYKNVPHLHFDISPSRVLATSPGDWPWLDTARVDRDYTNPRTFIFSNRPVKP